MRPCGSCKVVCRFLDADGKRKLRSRQDTKTVWERIKSRRMPSQLLVKVQRDFYIAKGASRMALDSCRLCRMVFGRAGVARTAVYSLKVRMAVERPPTSQTIILLLPMWSHNQTAIIIQPSTQLFESLHSLRHLIFPCGSAKTIKPKSALGFAKTINPKSALGAAKTVNPKSALGGVVLTTVMLALTRPRFAKRGKSRCATSRPSHRR